MTAPRRRRLLGYPYLQIALGVLIAGCLMAAVLAISYKDLNAHLTSTPYSVATPNPQAGHTRRPTYTRAPAATPWPTAAIQEEIGAEVRLHFFVGGWGYLAVDTAAHDELMEVVRSRDQLGLLSLQQSGKIFVVPDGTNVKILERSMYLAKVRVYEGPYMGRVGWVIHEAVD